MNNGNDGINPPGPGIPNSNPSPGTGGTGGSTPPSSSVRITDVEDATGSHFNSINGCASAVLGVLTVTATANPDVTLTARIIGPPTGNSLDPSTSFPNSSTDDNGTWTFEWIRFQGDGAGTTLYTIRVDALPPTVGADTANLNIVPNHTGVDPCIAHAIQAGALLVPPPAGYIEILFAPDVVEAAQPFWALVRAEPSSILPAAVAMYPLANVVNPKAWTAGGSNDAFTGKTIFRYPPANPLISIFEFTFPIWLREATISFSGYSDPYLEIVAVADIKAIR